jgi:glycosyltransferase involved in cell wall biosynthesis
VKGGNKMKRLLCIVSAMNIGGAETFLMKIYRCIDKTQYQMDFCVNSEVNFYSSEILKLGGKIHSIPTKSKHPIASFFAIKNIVKKNKYEYVIRVNEHSLSTIDLLAAKCGGATHLVMRTSNSSSGNKFHMILHVMFRFMPMIIPNVKIAPSKSAAEYTFGKIAVKNSKVKILPNGLDICKYEFNEAWRNKHRRFFNIEEKVVVGHVGRFSDQKNHQFLLDIFKEFKNQCPNSVLLLIGDGELKNQLKKRIKDLNLELDVIFAGIRADVNEIFSAMDIFVFPSLYEGMPNTVIEAQTSGLPCVISNSITNEAKVTELVKMFDLKLEAKDWAVFCYENFLRYKEDDRKRYTKEMTYNGYGIQDCAFKFCEYVYGAIV